MLVFKALLTEAVLVFNASLAAMALGLRATTVKGTFTVSAADLPRGVEDFLNNFSFAGAISPLERAMRSLVDSRGVRSGACLGGGVPRSLPIGSRLDDRPGEVFGVSNLAMSRCMLQWRWWGRGC